MEIVQRLSNDGLHASAIQLALRNVAALERAASPETFPSYLSAVQALADALVAKGELARAEDYYTRVLQGLERASRSRLDTAGVSKSTLLEKRGRCLFKMNRHKDALAQLKAIPESLRGYSVHYLIGQVCDVLGFSKQSTAAYLEAFRTNPYAVELIEPLAHGGASSRDLLRCARTARPEDVAWIEALITGHKATAEHKYDDAMTTFQALSDDLKSDVGPQLQMARLHASLDQYDEAVRLFEKVRSVDPHCVDHMDEFGSALHQRSRDAVVVAQGGETVTGTPAMLSRLAHSLLGVTTQRPEVWVVAAIAAHSAESPEALQLVESALKLDPCHSHALLVKGGLYLAGGAFAKAVTFFLKALNHRKSVHAHKGLVAACLEQGKVKEALLRARQALTAMPNDPRVLVMVAQVLSQTGGDAVAQAQRTFLRALAVKPGHPEALMSLAGLHSQEGEHGKALELLKQNTIPAHQPLVDYKLGIVTMESGAYDEALVYFHRALGANPDFVAVQDALERLEKLTRGEDPDLEDADGDEDVDASADYQ